MKNTSNKKRIIIIAEIIAALFIVTAVVTTLVTRNSVQKQVEKYNAQTFSEIDYNSMSRFNDRNVKAVLQALRREDSGKLSSLLTNSNGLDRVTAFADWKKADFDNAISMGSGSLSAKPDSKGRIDVSERLFVDVGDRRYVFFIETLTSRWGRKNEGVSAVAVTTFDHFDATDYEWNGERDDESELAGELFWERQMPSE